jgi:hypothetical protein
LGRIFDLGVREGHIFLIWGYAEEYNFDLGVRGYQKVENPWLRGPNRKASTTERVLRISISSIRLLIIRYQIERFAFLFFY